VRINGRPVCGSTCGAPDASIIGSSTGRAPNLEPEAIATSSADLIVGVAARTSSEGPVG